MVVISSVNGVIARNVRRLRKERGWSQAELSGRLSRETGRTWDHARVSRSEWDAESSPTEPEGLRRWVPDDLVAVAAVFEVPLQELFAVDESDLVKRGTGTVRGSDFSVLTFWLPSKYLRAGYLAELTFEKEHYGPVLERFRDAIRELYIKPGRIHVLEAVADGDESALADFINDLQNYLGGFLPEVARPRFAERIRKDMAEMGDALWLEPEDFTDDEEVSG